MYQKVYKYNVPSLVHLPIDIVYHLWYNILEVKDSPISTTACCKSYIKHKGAVTAWKDSNTKQLKGDTNYV